MLNHKNTFAPLAGRLLIDVNTWLNLENSEDRTRPYTIQGMECNLPHPILFLQCFTKLDDTKRSMYDGFIMRRVLACLERLTSSNVSLKHPDNDFCSNDE